MAVSCKEELVPESFLCNKWDILWQLIEVVGKETASRSSAFVSEPWI
ncbi:MAG: hypothetical protein AB1733_19395 [Thermodesulfobacteriota bacterium]